MSEIELEYRVPAEDLQPFVTLFYHFRVPGPVFDDVERADHAQFRVKLSAGEGRYRFPDGSERPSSGWHIVGPTVGPVRGSAVGPLEIIGVGLQPAGWQALLGIDASTMVNRVLDAEALFGDATVETTAALRVAGDTDEKIAVFEHLVRLLLKAGDSRTLDFARRIDAWLAGSASPDLDDLVESTGMSRRQVERRCNALYGAPPKVLARKYRALRAAVALASGGASLDELIGEGFYDQSHLIREMKQFTGLTPKQMRTDPTQLVKLTMARRLALGGQVHRIISET